jgi:uncharacterized protein
MTLDLPWGELAGLVVVVAMAGCLVGFLSGLLGIGGGGILVPILYEAFRFVGVAEAVRMHVSVGTALLIMIPTSLRTFQLYRARGEVDMDLLATMGPGVLAGVGLGALVARYANAAVIQWVFATSTGLMSLRLFLGRQHWRLGSELPGLPARLLYGLLVGWLSSLISIGGAVFINMFMTLYGRPMQAAIATSAGFGVIIALPGAAGFAWAGQGAAGLPPGSVGYVSLIGAACVIPATVLASPLGVRVAQGLSRRTLELAFASFLGLISLRFLVARLVG